MFDLGAFSLSDMLQCSAAVRRVAAGATSMEEAASAIVGYLHGSLIEKRTGKPSIALVRFYKTHPYERLEPALQDFARAAAGDGPNLHGVACLTLLASAGDQPEWNDRLRSRSHRAIPLPSVRAVDDSPMIAQLMSQLGVDVRHIVDPDPALFRQLDRASYNVFFVPEARGSVYVPAQNDFVVPFGIRSVLGFGGVLPNGSLFAVVMFSKTSIGDETADAFSTVALSAKLAILPFMDGRVFASDPGPGAEDPSNDPVALLRSEVDALNLLLEVRQDTVLEQSLRLELALQTATERHAELAASQAALAASQARKQAVVDGALDAIISMDSSGRVIEFNPAAETIFGWSRSEALGAELAELVIPYRFRDRHREGLDQYLRTGDGPALNRRMEVTAVRRDGTEFPVELTITPVPEAGLPIFTGYIRDITDRRAGETALIESRERFAHVARTLQESLLPPQLPRLPGIELGSAYRAAGVGNDVGGDFYDVFETGRGDWALTLGDVCGKGPEAAALTALARYTLRAAAMRARKPSSVLSTLNEAVNRQHPERFCTVVYARLRIDAHRLRLTIASGGHPPVLLMTESGTVSEIDIPGMLVGPFPDWTGRDRTLELRPGDVVVMYSDGVPDAGAGKDRFGSDRVASTLRACVGRPAQEIADELARAAIDFAGAATDDIAVLVARVRRP